MPRVGVRQVPPGRGRRLAAMVALAAPVTALAVAVVLIAGAPC